MPEPEEQRLFSKPLHGYWTSTYLGSERISEWAEWCRGEDFHCGSHRLWLFQVDPVANVFHIDSCDDLILLHEKYGISITDDYRSLDFKAIAGDYDGIHLTKKGQQETRFTHPYNLYGWDCESTVWFQWVFTDIQDAGLVTLRTEPGID